MLDKVGLIPVDSYLSILNGRNFSKEFATKYTLDTYNIDISAQTEWYIFNFTSNIFNDFDENNSTPKMYRQRYLKFLDTNNLSRDKDIYVLFEQPHDVHHIFPKCYGGTDDIKNLCYVSTFTHNILHENPLERIEKYNHQALDYLYYLNHFNGDYILDKYNVEQYKFSLSRLMKKVYKACLEEEMYLFYDYIQKKQL